MDWIIASAGVRRGHPAPEERCPERPLAWKVVRHAAAVAAVAAAAAAAAEAVKQVAATLWHHVDCLMKKCRGL